MQALIYPENLPLSPEESRQAEATGVAIQRFLNGKTTTLEKATLRLSIEPAAGEKSELLLPDASLPLLSTILRELGHGKSVMVLAADAEVSTQQAADFLRVSRPYFVKLLEEGKIPYRLVGPRRRVLLADLLQYKDQEEAARHRGLDELVAEAQNLGMY